MPDGLLLALAIVTWAAIVGPMFAFWLHASRHGLSRRSTRRPPAPPMAARGGFEAGPVAPRPLTGPAKPRKVVRG